MHKRLRVIMLNGLVCIGTISVMIGVLEWGLRITGVQRMESRKPHLHQASAIPGVHYSFVPNLKNERGYNWERISTNSLGFRGPELDPNKPDIVLVGDSFVFGFGMNDDESQDAHLQRAFPDYDVVNMGVNGYNIEQEARAFMARPKEIDPALLIVEFVFNDMKPPSILTDEESAEVYALDGYLERGEKADRKLEAAITKPGTLEIPFKFWLTKHSALFNFVEKRTKWLPFRYHEDRSAIETITAEDLAFYRTWFTKLAGSAPQAKKLFVIWPEPADHVESRKALTSMARQQGFLVLDLYDLFGKKYPTLSWDWHPNAKAQKQAAELLIRLIKEEKLLGQ